ncbi:RNA polymerase sigma factor SigM [Gordonia sp. ABSL1-1]|uniref:RNA polymerase sigma factor SigM n=1 Tax=Gordonia sp. ABSL1-1 TaxID=3053923 RepID=UPI002572FEE5|nr:RNA polymerase sigma factor SigM [Gordonia sp. ABSL1-1]MDL9936607.1 RNA polymerase sigma factor SigM [Gordonia sp. ABSL1-1]
MTRGKRPLHVVDERTDEQLLADHVTGDPTAFAALVHRHLNYLYSIAYRTTGNPEDANDAVQDALLNAHRTAGQYRSDAKVIGWLHRIVVNASLDRIRRNRVRPTVPLPERVGTELADPTDHTVAVDLSLSIGRALDVLPAKQRAAIVAVDIEGYSIADAAILLGVAEGTVKSRCARGRLRLAKVLGHLREC